MLGIGGQGRSLRRPERVPPPISTLRVCRYGHRKAAGVYTTGNSILMALWGGTSQATSTRGCGVNKRFSVLRLHHWSGVAALVCSSRSHEGSTRPVSAPKYETCLGCDQKKLGPQVSGTSGETVNTHKPKYANRQSGVPQKNVIVCGFDSHLGHVDEYWKRYHREYYRQRRKEVFDYMGYQHCIQCGSTDNLEIDHIDPGQKSFNISMRLSPRQPDVQAELDKCQILCRECHEEKTAAENSGFTHGSMYAWMNKKCRCDICKPAWRAWNDERNERRHRAVGNVRGHYGRPSTHGEYLHYKRGCRCDDCRAANAAKAQEWKKNASGRCPNGRYDKAHEQ